MIRDGYSRKHVASLLGYSENGLRSVLAGEGLTAPRRSAQLVYGCSLEEAMVLNDGLLLSAQGGKAVAFTHQRAGAKNRGVGWDMTFPEWVGIWIDSGKYPLRGHCKGQYVMARHNDVGPYKLGNVSIQTCTQNCRENLQRCTKDGAATRTGAGRGWTYIAHRPRRPYRVVFKGRFVGEFATEEDARAAYRAATDKFHAARRQPQAD